MSDKCKKCTTNNNPFIGLSANGVGGGKKINIIGDDFIDVQVQRTDEEDTFFLSFEQYEELVITQFNSNQALALQGNTVSALTLTWQYNKQVQSQSILGGGIDDSPTISGSESYSKEYTGLSIEEDTTIVLTADDIIGDDIPPKTRNTQVLFGNYLYFGALTIVNTQTYVLNENDVVGLTKQIRRSATASNPINYTNEGLDSYMIFAAPSRFNVSNFQDSGNPVPGGFVLMGQINITNDASDPFTEEYNVWRSTFGDLAGTDPLTGQPFRFNVLQ